ncbi:DUF6286 domain-containing protein [Kitasatospora sp. NPDC085895]|uniref:DUF6286 domain-containing protein n=1 Tax=Kitasatospora sp. NPDC085895 TaxID=3155057 RepID=UPI00344CD286
MGNDHPHEGSGPAGDRVRAPRPAAAVLTKGTDSADPVPEDGTKSRRGHRMWSARRWPAAVAAALITAGAGLLLYDVCAVRAGRRAFTWRTRLAEELATRPVDDTWILVGATVAAALGLLLLVLALTPGKAGLLPMRAPEGGPGIRAYLERRGAETVLRDAAWHVPGVARARIAAHRRRIDARADVRYRDLQEVHDDLTQVLGAACDGLALTRPPRLRVRVRRSR